MPKTSQNMRWWEGIDRLTSQGKMNYLFVPGLIVSQAREVSTLEPSPRSSISTEGWTLKLIGVSRDSTVWISIFVKFIEIDCSLPTAVSKQLANLKAKLWLWPIPHPQTGPSGPSVDGGQCRWFFIDLQLLLMPFGAPDSPGSGDVNPPGVRVEGGAGPPNHDIICFAMVCGWTPGAALAEPPRSGSGGWDVLKPGLVRCSWRRGGPGKSLESASEKQVRNQAFLISGELNSKEFTVINNLRLSVASLFFCSFDYLENEKHQQIQVASPDVGSFAPRCFAPVHNARRSWHRSGRDCRSVDTAPRDAVWAPVRRRPAARRVQELPWGVLRGWEQVKHGFVWKGGSPKSRGLENMRNRHYQCNGHLVIFQTHIVDPCCKDIGGAQNHTS